MMKITGIIIIILAAIVAVFCLIFKIRFTPPERNKKTVKARFLVAVSIMMAFFISFFTGSCGSDNNVVQRPTPTPTAIPTPLCYTPTPSSIPTPLCYTPTPSLSPTPLCYTPTPSLSPTPLCYTPTPSSGASPDSYKNEKDILSLKLSIVEEISGKNIVKDSVLNMAKENILRQIDLLDKKES